MNSKFVIGIVIALYASGTTLFAQGSPRSAEPVTVDTMLLIDTSQNAKPTRFRNIKPKLDEAKLQARRRPAFSFSDSVTGWFGSPRYDQKPVSDRFTFRSDADYFRFTPQFSALPYQEVSMRTTVSPFGLPGRRITLAPGGRAVTLFEHVPATDGNVDFEDLPNALDNNAFVIPGPIGLLYGGDQVAGALITKPQLLATTNPQSALIVDKGDYGFALTRGRLNKLFGDGRRADLSVAYRKTDGVVVARRDDSYLYDGTFYSPVGTHSAISTSGWLYTRDGNVAVDSDDFFGTIARYRFERHLEVSYMKFDTARTSRLELGYRHASQGSHMDLKYRQWFEQITHTGFARKEWSAGSTLLRGNAQVETQRYGYSLGKKNRTTGDLSLSALRRMGGWSTGTTIGTRYTKDFKTLPYALLTTMCETQHSFLHLSAGYVEQAPSQHQLFLPYTISSFRSGGIYSDSGNAGLKSEKQMILSGYAEYGSIDNALGVSIAGGKINDAVDWVRYSANDTVVQTPENVDLTFYDIAGTLRFRVSDLARFNAGAGYQHLTRKDNRPKYYAPDMVAHSGMELHWFWKPKLVHFYAYGELAYIGKYTGYVVPNLGDQVTASARFSFEMGPFRFNYDFHNITSIDYQSRDGLYLNGRFISYGFTWKFIN